MGINPSANSKKGNYSCKTVENPMEFLCNLATTFLLSFLTLYDIRLRNMTQKHPVQIEERFSMDINKVAIGKNPPHEVNVIIEVPMGADPVKYEFDKESGAIVVDRMLHTAMYYPCNYGFVPHTLSADGDPADVLVLSEERLIPGCVICVRPLGVLIMEDEAGRDEKILAVPTSKISPLYNKVQSIDDLPQIKLDQIAHFFTHYKDLEKNKWVKVIGWEGVDSALKVLEEAIDNGKAAKK